MDKFNVLSEIPPIAPEDSFVLFERHKMDFSFPVHIHNECELNYVSGAAGAIRVVGDNIEEIGDRDLVLIAGSRLEHAWFNGHKAPDAEITEITIQFSSDLFFKSCLNKNQFDSIKRMLERAQCGLCFPMEAIMKVYHWLDRLASEEQGFYAVLNFLRILYELSLYDDARPLASSSFAKIETLSESRRVRKVQTYIAAHFREDLRLPQLAEMVGMTPVAFSRFFRLRTGKTLSDYVLDIRLGSASRLLVDSAQTVAEICYDCGFNNLSNFNRLFRKKKGCAPKEFRENYRKKKIVV